MVKVLSAYELGLVPWASFQGWPRSYPWAETGSPGGWSGACGTPHSSPSRGADASCHDQKAGRPSGERERGKIWKEAYGGKWFENRKHTRAYFTNGPNCVEETGVEDVPPVEQTGWPHSSTHLLSAHHISPPEMWKHRWTFIISIQWDSLI